MTSVTVVVAERGANWLGWAHELRGPSNSLIVLAQHPQEEAEAFGQRVTEKLDRLQDTNSAPDQVIYVGGERWDDPARNWRTRLLRIVSSLLGRSGSAVRLYLDASQPRAAHLMRALAWALTDATRGTGLSISVATPALA
jgi:hypothetical protein